MRLQRAGGGEFEVEILAQQGSTIRVRIDGREINASFDRTGDGGAVIVVNGSRYQLFGAKIRDRILVASGPASFEFKEIAEGRSRGVRGLTTPEIVAPMPGKVLRIHVTEGQQVGTGDGLIVLEAMKMETTLAAESPARIRKILVSEGQTVDHGAVLIELAPVTPGPSPRESAPQDP